MTDDLRTRIAEVIVGSLLGQAEARGDYASYDFDPNDPAWNLVHLDTSIDPVTVADAVIAELGPIPDRRHVDDEGRAWEWCGGGPGTWAWRITALRKREKWDCSQSDWWSDE